MKYIACVLIAFREFDLGGMCWRELLFHKKLTSWINGLLFVDNVKNSYVSQLYSDVVRRFSGICSLPSLPPRMWLLNVRERKLSGGGSTRRSFLIDLRVVHYCGRILLH